MPFRADRGQHAVAELGGEAALRHGDHPQRGRLRDLPGLDQGEVLDAVPRVMPRILRQRLGVRLERYVDGPVADGVRGHLPAGAVRGDDRGLQFLRVGLQIAYVPPPGPGVDTSVAAAVRPTRDPS